MAENSTDYFKKRAEAEWQRSRDAGDPRAAAAHAEMAGRYEDMAARFQSAPEEERQGVRERLGRIFRFRDSFS